MTRADAAKLVAIVVTAYPAFDKFKDAEAVKATVGLWAAMFAADSAEAVGLAVREHIATSKWPPSVAEIRELMADAQHPELIPPDRAWAAVSDLLYSRGERCGGEIGGLLPPLVARAAETIGWRSLWAMHCAYAQGGKPGLDRAAFLEQYRPMYEREKKRAMMPAGLAASRPALPGSGPALLADREADRRKRDEEDSLLAGRARR